jgi:lipopolysaccharide/colanic/teichoic acid biosynthesis glycosyltransferase
MYVDAEKDGPQWASLDDTRITKLGRFLRISRIDELPQIINIIKGNINLIGPRAERPEMRDIIIKHIPNFNDRLLIKPGITGLAQISSGYSNNIDQMITKLEEDILYIRSKSILLDLKIIYKTIFIILKLLGT